MKRAIATVLIAVSLISACSSGTSTKADPSTTTAIASTTTAAASTTVATTSTPTTVASTTTVAPTTMPPTTTTAPLNVTFQDLIDRYDAAVAAILADPRVASDTSNPLIVAYLAMFPPNSTFPTGALKFWAEEGRLGRFYRPGPAGVMTKSTVQTVTPASDSEATFTICSTDSTTIVDGAGALVESSGGVTSGTIAAIKVDGIWLLRDLSRTSADACPKPGAGG